MSATPFLLDDAIRRKLDALMLMGSKVRAGAIKGERRSSRRGTSIEFADYRNYAPGDDLRRLDWNIYARTERPYIKLLEDEEDLAVHVLLDNSASMEWPPRDDEDYALPASAHKLLYAQRLAAGLAYISLNSNDHLTLTAINAAPGAQFGPARGRRQSVNMLRHVQAVGSGGVTDLNAALTAYSKRAARPGVCFVISDLFSPSGFVDGVKRLLAKGHEVAMLHVLSPDEVEPPLVGDLRLIDIETGSPQEISLDSGMRALYMERVAAWRDEVRADCARLGVHYLPLVTDSPWEQVILLDLRRLGLVK